MAFLDLRNVTFKYPGQKRTVLAGINLTFDKAGITAIMGPNGCGKTTLTKLMVGLLVPITGEISLENRPLGTYSLAEIGRRIGYVFQNPDRQLFCTTVEEEIGFGLKNMGWKPAAVRERVEFYLEYFELAAYRRVFPLHLSQGEKQRLAMAAVLAGEPGFLILDEPTAGLDAYRKTILGKFIRKIAALGRGTVIVSHDTTFVRRIAERVITVENGQISRDNRQIGDHGCEA